MRIADAAVGRLLHGQRDVFYVQIETEADMFRNVKSTEGHWTLKKSLSESEEDL